MGGVFQIVVKVRSEIISIFIKEIMLILQIMWMSDIVVIVVQSSLVCLRLLLIVAVTT